MQAGTWSLVDQQLLYGIAGSPAGLAVVFAGLEVAPLVGDHLQHIQRLILKLMPQFTSEPELPLLKDHLERVCEEKDAIMVRQREVMASQRQQLAIVRSELASVRSGQQAMVSRRKRQRELAVAAEARARARPPPRSLVGGVAGGGSTRSLGWMQAACKQAAEDRVAIAKRARQDNDGR